MIVNFRFKWKGPPKQTFASCWTGPILFLELNDIEKNPVPMPPTSRIFYPAPLSDTQGIWEMNVPADNGPAADPRLPDNSPSRVSDPDPLSPFTRVKDRHC